MITEGEFLNIYNEYYHKIIQYLSKIVGPNDAEDMAQDVFDKISRNLGGFNGKSKLSTWIYRIATNTAIDRLRSASYKQTSGSTPLKDTSGFDNRIADNPFGSPATDQALIRREMSGCVNEYIDNLPSDYKAVLVFRELEGLPNREIADILEISLDNVKIRLYRARAKLKVLLSDGCDFYHNEQDVFACDRKPSHILPKTPK